MTKLLEKGIAAVKALPADRQDMIGALLLDIAEAESRKYMLTPEQLAELELSIAQADRGEFATEAEVEAMWKKFG
jgi:predicted transcriptional regulator